MMVRAGLPRDAASFISIGAGQNAVAALRRGEIDAMVSVDPVINLLESEGAIKIVADTRTVEGTRQVYGGLYPAAVLYLTPAYAQSNPAATQSLVNAFVRGLKWVAKQSPEEIAKVMPEQYMLGNKELYIRSIKSSIPMYSPDGRFGHEGPEIALKVLREFDPDVRRATIDLAKTYTEDFVSKVPAR